MGAQGTDVAGRVHSIQSLGAVDGPGLRSVVFLQGCPLRCAYCHNPDTWEFGGGEEMSVEALAKRLLRFRGYWGPDSSPKKTGPVSGGVTVSGGEPLAQPEFTAKLFSLLHEAGVHTALDTSGAGDLNRAGTVLDETDLAIVDLKFLTEDEYRRFCGGSLSRTEELLRMIKERKIPLWIRHVAVPGLTADLDYMRRIRAAAESYSNLEKLEFLPFHNLCMEKYERLGIAFPLKDTKVMEDPEWQELVGRVWG